MKDKIKILLVDDHQIVLDGIKKMLEKENKFVVEAECLNATSALHLIDNRDDKFDLAIIDISMPDISGIELCRLIKEKKSKIKVLVLSMHQNIAYVKEAIRANADGYMLKNINQIEFIHGLESVIDDGSYFSKEILPFLFREAKLCTSETQDVSLSKRELEVLELIVNEYTSKQIAEKLFISKQTVDTHRINIMQKTGSKSLVGLIKYAFQKGILTF